MLDAVGHISKSLVSKLPPLADTAPCLEPCVSRAAQFYLTSCHRGRVSLACPGRRSWEKPFSLNSHLMQSWMGHLMLESCHILVSVNYFQCQVLREEVWCMPACHTGPLATSNNVKVKTVRSSFYSTEFKRKQPQGVRAFQSQHFRSACFMQCTVLKGLQSIRWIMNRLHDKYLIYMSVTHMTIESTALYFSSFST